MFNSKIIDKWMNLLEDDPEATHPRQWVGFYYKGMHDLPFMVLWADDLIRYARQQYHPSMPLTIKCFMMGTHLICLSK